MIEVDLNHGNSESTAVFVVDLGTPRVLLDCRQLLHAIYNIALKWWHILCQFITQQGMHFFLDILQIIFSGNVNAITNFTFS